MNWVQKLRFDNDLCIACAGKGILFDEKKYAHVCSSCKGTGQPSGFEEEIA